MFQITFLGRGKIERLVVKGYESVIPAIAQRLPEWARTVTVYSGLELVDVLHI